MGVIVVELFQESVIRGAGVACSYIRESKLRFRDTFAGDSLHSVSRHERAPRGRTSAKSAFEQLKIAREAYIESAPIRR